MTTNINPYEKMPAEGRTSLRPEETKTYGIQRFLDEQAKRGSVSIPDFAFTAEENRLLDELLAAERRPTDESEVRADDED